LDGTDDRYDGPNGGDLNAAPALQITARVQPAAVASNQYLFNAQTAGETFGALLWLSLTALAFTRPWTGGGKFRRTPTGVVGAGVWTTLSVVDPTNVSTASSMRIFKDGVEQSYDAPSAVDGTGAPTALTGSWIVGGRTADNARNFGGALAHVFVHQAQIDALQLHAEPYAFLRPRVVRRYAFPGAAAPAAGWGPLLEGQRNRLVVA